jgi:hypothetical protein
MKRVRKHTHSVQRHRLCQRHSGNPDTVLPSFCFLRGKMLHRYCEDWFRDSKLGNEISLIQIWWLICLLASSFLNFVCQQSHRFDMDGASCLWPIFARLLAGTSSSVVLGSLFYDYILASKFDVVTRVFQRNTFWFGTPDVVNSYQKICVCSYILKIS